MALSIPSCRARPSPASSRSPSCKRTSTTSQSWKRQARGQLLELLHYAPPRCDPRPETVERVDRGDYVREKVHFNTTPDVRVPAYVLIPKRARLPAPAIVALHDHGGFYLWGKEKLVERDDEHPVLTDFKRRGLRGQEHRHRAGTRAVTWWS